MTQIGKQAIGDVNASMGDPSKVLAKGCARCWAFKRINGGFITQGGKVLTYFETKPGSTDLAAHIDKVPDLRMGSSEGLSCWDFTQGLHGHGAGPLCRIATDQFDMVAFSEAQKTFKEGLYP